MDKDQIKAIDKLINSLTTENQRALSDVSNKIKETLKTNGDALSENATDILDKAAGLASEGRFKSIADQRKVLDEIEKLEKRISIEKDGATRKILSEHLKSLKTVTKENTGLTARVGGLLTRHIDTIGGIATGLLSESPIFAVLAAKGIEKIKEVGEAKAEARRAEIEELEKQRNILLEKQSDTSLDQNETLDNIDEGIGEVNDNLERLQAAQENDTEQQLDLFYDRLKADQEMEQERIEREEEARREALAAEKQPMPIEQKPEKEKKGGLLSGLVLGIKGLLSGFKKNLLLALSGAFGMVTGFVKGLGKLFLGALKRIFLPIAIVGALFSGITSAVEEYKKTGNITEAIFAALQGIVEFITFGLIDKDKFDTARAWLGEQLTHMLATFTDMWKGISAWVSDNFGGVGASLTGVFGQVGEIMIKIKDHILAPFKKMWELIDTTFPGITSSITGLGDQIIEGFRTMIRDLLDLLPSSVIDLMPDSVKQELEDVGVISKAEQQTGQVETITRENLAEKKRQAREDADRLGLNVNQVNNSTNVKTTNVLGRPSARGDDYMPAGVY